MKKKLLIWILGATCYSHLQSVCASLKNHPEACMSQLKVAASSAPTTQENDPASHWVPKTSWTRAAPEERYSLLCLSRRMLVKPSEQDLKNGELYIQQEHGEI